VKRRPQIMTAQEEPACQPAAEKSGVEQSNAGMERSSGQRDHSSSFGA
jgi:hypothetical protein